MHFPVHTSEEWLLHNWLLRHDVGGNSRKNSRKLLDSPLFIKGLECPNLPLNPPPPPSTNMLCLGINVDSVSQTLLWRGKHVSIACDNMSAVEILSHGHTKDLALAAMARNIWLQSATFDFTLHVYHISGKCNTTADLLSRWHVPP